LIFFKDLRNQGLDPRHAEKLNPKAMGGGCYAQIIAKSPKYNQKLKQALPNILKSAYYSTWHTLHPADFSQYTTAYTAATRQMLSIH